MWPDNFISLWGQSHFLAGMLLADALVVGACVGTFCATAGTRFRLREHDRFGVLQTITRQARCPRCYCAIEPRDNIPLVSWLRLRGHCRHCHGRIGLRYPLAELGSAVLTAWVVWTWGATFAALAGVAGAWALIWFVFAAPYLLPVLPAPRFVAVAINPDGLESREMDSEQAPEARVGESDGARDVKPRRVWRGSRTLNREKARKVREANRRSAEEHASTERKLLPLHDYIGPFSQYDFRGGHWSVREARVVVTENSPESFMYRVVMDGVEGMPEIPGAPDPVRDVSASGWCYGPYKTRAAGFDALRVHMLRWSLLTLLIAYDHSGVELPILRNRLRDAANELGNANIAQTLPLSVWVRQLSNMLRLRGERGVVVEALTVLHNSLVHAQPLAFVPGGAAAGKV